MAEHVCPWWVGYILASPIRRLLQQPEAILAPYVRRGMTTLDVGCAMGFFSVPMAELVGPRGRVLCVDLQEKMLHSLEKRARKAGVAQTLELHRCSTTSLELEGQQESVDFALAFAMIHEVPDQRALLTELHELLKPGARLLVAEPKGHVSVADFDATLQIAAELGFSILEQPVIRRSHTALLAK